jgi:ectoine hydroxylase-related dioxygenase (phytanoyl-CoA dioxygenase family)
VTTPPPTTPGTADAGSAAFFAETGWLLTDTLDAEGVALLREWADEVAAWPAEGDGWLHHRELTDDGAKLCRSENIIPFHTGLRLLLTSGRLLADASMLLGQPAVLYKEKINYKLPGGAGYAPHQDAPAYRFVETHVSCMVAIDDATVDNGCLEVVSGRHHDVLPTDDTGCIRDDVVAAMHWAPVEVRAGQTLWFHSRTPHRSGPNGSAAARRALYPTYNAAAEGDRRDDYYRQKLAEFAAAGPARDGGHVQVSLIGDFQGRAVS